jgi:hypothetical protein
MIFDRPGLHPDTVPFFVSPPAWVLVNEASTGELRVATESDDEGRAILCFLSPLDALIEAARFTQLAQVYHVMLAAHLDGTLFRDPDERGLVGWPTQGGRILLRPGGALGRYARTIHIWADDPPWFEADPATIEMIDGLLERAGLFVWRENPQRDLRMGRVASARSCGPSASHGIGHGRC